MRIGKLKRTEVFAERDRPSVTRTTDQTKVTRGSLRFLINILLGNKKRFENVLFLSLSLHRERFVLRTWRSVKLRSRDFAMESLCDKLKLNRYIDGITVL